MQDLILENFHEPLIQDPTRRSGRGGGLATYINKRVCALQDFATFNPSCNVENDLSGEFQFVKIHNCKGSAGTKIIINVYRSPSKRVNNFAEKLAKV